MKRSGFKRPQLEHKPVVHVPLDPRFRRQVSFEMTTAAPIPKRPPGRNAAFRELARGKPCMLQIPYVCSRDPETTVLAHSNSQADGKGMGMKSCDSSGVWACYACHSWLDQGGMAAVVKGLAWRRARERMQGALEDLVDSPTTKPRDREAAQWALERIKGLAPAT